MLVVSLASFNRIIGVPAVLSITKSSSFARIAGFAVSLMGISTSTVGVIRWDQPRSIDICARKGRKIESLPPAIIAKVLAKLTTILK